MTEREELEELEELEALEVKAGMASATSRQDFVRKKTLETLKRTGKLVSGSLARGAMAPGAFIADLPRNMNPPEAALFKTEEEAAAMPEGGGWPISEFWKNFGTKPEGPGEELLDATLSGVASVATGGPLGVTKAARWPWLLAEGAGGGLGSEVAAKTVDEGPVARILGALLGSAGVASPQIFFGNTRDLAHDALRDVDELDLTEAAGVMRGGEAAGVPLNVSQAMPQPSGLDTLIEALAQTEAGEQTIAQLRRQPAQIQNAAERRAGDLPGNMRQPQQAANEAQLAATERIKQVKRYRSEQFKKALGNADEIQIPQVAMKRIDDELQARVAAAPNTGLADLLQGLRAKLHDPRIETKELDALLDLDAPTGGAFEGDYLTRLGELNAVLRSQASQIKGPRLDVQAIDAEEAAKFAAAIKMVRAELKATSPEFAEAYRVYENVSRQQLDPLRKSVVGRIAGKKGALADQEAIRSRAFKVFDDGTLPNSGTSDILTLERELRKVDAESFPNLAKTWLVDKLGTASKVKGNRPSPEIPANIEKIFAGDAKTRQGLKDILVGMARSQSLPDNALYPGFQNFMTIVQSAARRPAIIGARSAQEITDKARDNWGSRLLYSLGFAPLTRAGTGVAKWYGDRAFTTLDKLVTTPEGIDTLRELAKVPPMSKKAEVIVTGFLSGLATQETDTETQGN